MFLKYLNTFKQNRIVLVTGPSLGVSALNMQRFQITV